MYIYTYIYIYIIGFQIKKNFFETLNCYSAIVSSGRHLTSRVPK